MGAVTFNCYAAAFNLAQVHIETGHLKEALFYTELALYFSHDIHEQKERNSYRANSHYLRGCIKFKMTGAEVGYTEFLDIVSELQKSIAYKKEEQNSSKLEAILSLVDSEKIKSQLISNSTTLAFENGTYKTCAEFFSSAGKSKEEVAEWIKYQDPRTSKANTSSSAPIPDEKDALNNLLKNLGMFAQAEGCHSTEGNDKEQQCSIM